MLKRLRDSEFADRASDIRAATLYGNNNEKLGTIDDVIFDPSSQTAKYAIIDTGGWLKSRKFLVPSDHIRSSATDPDAFHIALTKQQIEDLPAYDDDVINSDERFSDFENRYRSRWSSYGLSMPESRHPRIQRFESGLGGMRTPVVTTTATSGRTVGSAGPSAGKPVSVYGVYDQRDKLERAVERLKNEGFNSSDISVVFPDKGRTEKFAVEHNTKAPEGATVGGGTGMIAGGVLGWLAGIGTLAIPGIGPLLAAGPIVGALAGAGVGGAVGGLAGALIGLGMPEIEAKRYEREVKEGRILLSVRCDDQRVVHSARSILDATNARDVFQTGERKAA